MKRSASAAWAATILAVLCGTAFAGEKGNVPVTLETNASGQVVRAFGMMGTARNSADTKQLIGCFIGAAGNSLQAGCEAQNAAGANTMCLSSNAGVIAAVQSVGPDSYIDFARDGAGNCTSVYVANGSSTAVKQP
ncbi:hypothetical protein J5226_02790 [Lysobacter sp. K5869]|uniref:hypothetical protein n=1 Tax=Lysobacter sp. K5869 TaxID=2820808 RepID=UPI001C05FDFE|nr:hypothetical protein [Lysobacter sp. K5869]QWP77350.1 hypothetical protein J5226_02790 [Lysobacter sp. K5869]